MNRWHLLHFGHHQHLNTHNVRSNVEMDSGSKKSLLQEAKKH